MWTPELAQLSPANEPTVFAISAWHELFDPFTPDTFQPRIHNIPSLVCELEDLSGRLCANPDDMRWKQHIHLVKEECRSLVAEEQELLRQVPEYQWLLERMLGDDEPRNVRLNCSILKQRQHVFESSIFQRLDDATQTLPNNTKRAFHKALRAVATLGLQDGKEDDDLLESADFSVTAPVADTVDWMKQLVTRENVEFDCVFVVAGKDVGFLSRVGFQSFKRRQLPQDEMQRYRSMYGDNGFHCVTVKVRASSYRTANAKAAGKLATAFNVYNLHANSAEIKKCSKSFVRPTGQGKFRIFNQEEPAYRRLRRRGRVIEDTNESIELFSSGDVDERILNALELHSTALASSEPRVRLVNLWSALECLSGCCDGKSIIDRVCQLVTPILVWRRIDKLVRYIAIETKTFGDHQGRHDYGDGFRRSHPDFVHPWDLMETLAKPDGHDHLRAYSTFVAQHPYLRYRATTLWKLINDPNEMSKSQEASASRVRWQLYRIYRARNILVHQGEEAPLFIALLDNLMYYTSVVISRVLHGLKVDNTWGVREAWEFWKLKSDYVRSSLVRQPSVLKVSDFFPRTYEGSVAPLWSQ